MRDIFLGFNQILLIATDFRRSLQYQILRKSFKWEQRWYIRTDKTKLIGFFATIRTRQETINQ